MKFEDVEVGMEVKIITDGWGTGVETIGKVYHVAQIHEGKDNKNIYLRMGDGTLKRVYPEGFEPVSTPSHRFHVGQPVRCISYGLSDLTNGSVYIITEIESTWIKVVNDVVKQDGYRPQWFEPAYALEVGCKVRVVNHSSAWNGYEGTVTKVTSGYNAGIRQPGKKDVYFSKDLLIVLEPAAKKVKSKGITMCHDEASTFGGDTYEAISELMEQDNNGSLHTCSTPVWGKSIHSTIIGKWADNIKTYGGNEMKNENYEKLAKKMNDEYVGSEGNTIFLKKAGECSVEVRNVTITLTPSDIEAILKEKGISKALGTFEMEEIYHEITVHIVKFTPIESKKNEAD